MAGLGWFGFAGFSVMYWLYRGMAALDRLRFVSNLAFRPWFTVGRSRCGGLFLYAVIVLRVVFLWMFSCSDSHARGVPLGVYVVRVMDVPGSVGSHFVPAPELSSNRVPVVWQLVFPVSPWRA